MCFSFLHFLFVPCHLHRLEQVDCRLWESVCLCLWIVFKNMTKFNNNTRKTAELPTRLRILHISYSTRLIFCEKRVLSTVVLKFRAVQHKKTELGLACWNVLISFWEVNLRQLKLEVAKDSKSGTAYILW